MLKGDIGPQLIGLSVPLLAGNILRQLYNTVDAVIVGRFAGGAAFAYHLSSGVLRAVGNTRAALFFPGPVHGDQPGAGPGAGGRAVHGGGGAALATGLGWIGVVTFWTPLVWKEISNMKATCADLHG